MKNYEEISLYLLGNVIGHKKIEILLYIVKKANDDGLVNITYDELIDELNVSRPTVAAFFKQMVQAKAMKKLKNSIYELNLKNLP